ncbi:hypothetical protein C9374_001197 [Naegleria lovaniensis]|uniref:RCC1-like domain-containing protein n=1 Tax=Naegleria lovaniensis TaxID=51637 RepID=A0AA88GWG0_NAELO|nr:uncharacterized protein C9374_001197 [Naegleria lovaniensis]KAG2387603.1 hypothetical protein C9374_001197 [Naegleria lovaniensis]
MALNSHFSAAFANYMNNSNNPNSGNGNNNGGNDDDYSVAVKINRQKLPIRVIRNIQESYLKGKALFQAFGEHQFDVQGNINTCAFVSGTGEYIVKISSGAHHTLMLTNDGKILSFGKNLDGQLGIGERKAIFQKDISVAQPQYQFSDETAIDVCCGSNHSVILTNYGNILACGWNEFHQYGTTVGNDASKFSYVEYNNAAQMIRCGNNATIVLSVDNELSMCGTGIIEKGRAFNSLTSLEDFSKLLSSSEHISDIQCGAEHIVVRTSFNSIYVVGQNTYHQLGSSFSEHRRFVDITKKLPFKRDELLSFACGLYHTLFLCKSGAVYVSGYNGYGQLGIGTLRDSDFELVTDFYKYDLTSVYRQGVLSTFDTSMITYTCHVIDNEDKSQYTIDQNEIIKQVYAGSNHSLLVSNLGNIYSFGFGRFGQLNLNTSQDNNPHVTQMFLPKSMIDTTIFSNSAANITILADRQPINSWMYNNLRKRARQGELFDIKAYCQN